MRKHGLKVEAKKCPFFSTKVTSPPVLSYPVYTKPFIVEVDASNDGLGAVLSQEQDGKIIPIAYGSRALRRAERNMENYSSRKLELLALM